MSTTKTTKAIVATGILALALGGAATLQAGGHAGMGRGMARMNGLRAALGSVDLTDDQKSQIRDLMEKQRPVMQGLRQQLKADHDALQTAASDTKNLAAIGSAYLKVQTDREAMKAQMKSSRDAISAILTPEQRAKLEGFRDGFRGRMGRFGHPPASND